MTAQVVHRSQESFAVSNSHLSLWLGDPEPRREIAKKCGDLTLHNLKVFGRTPIHRYLDPLEVDDQLAPGGQWWRTETTRYPGVALSGHPSAPIWAPRKPVYRQVNGHLHSWEPSFSWVGSGGFGLRRVRSSSSSYESEDMTGPLVIRASGPSTIS